MDKYHTFWKRLVSAIIDGMVLFPLMFLYKTNNPFLFYIGIIVESVITILYFVILHGKYGQTLGKKITGIKVLDINETKFIGFKRAALREVPWIIVTILTLIYLFSILFRTNNPNIAFEKYSDFSFYISFGWFIIELITMLTNDKRRALHDWLARSVVTKTNTVS